MRNTLYSIFILFSAFGCVQPKAELETYYDLKGLLQAQAGFLGKGNFSLEKKLSIVDSTETKILKLDSAEWMKQFDLLMTFSLTEPSLIGAFQVTKTDDGESYLLKEGQKASIKTFQVEGNQSKQTISGKMVDEKSIYSDSKTFQLQMENGQLVSFQVFGQQKMIFKDTVDYSIEAKVIAQ
jgi:hypothetical protein